jgi:hypothetical protein
LAYRVIFLVAGFNLHYSLLEAPSLLGIDRLRWLNADALLTSYLGVIDSGAVLIPVALGDTVRARGMKEVARRAGLGRESLGP